MCLVVVNFSNSSHVCCVLQGERMLSLLVENGGRVNYGKALDEQRKGTSSQIILLFRSDMSNHCNCGDFILYFFVFTFTLSMHNVIQHAVCVQCFVSEYHMFPAHFVPLY